MSTDSNKEYSVNWKNHMSHVRKAFDHLLNTNELTDVTLYCEGKKIGAHKMLLSACSTYFRDTFKEVPCQHPVIIMYGVEYSVLLDILHFIYRGEVSVDNSKLDTFLKTAQLLQISGLSDDPSEKLISGNDHITEVLNSNEEEQCHSIDSPVQASPVKYEQKSTAVGTKRFKNNEAADAPKEKVQRSANDTVFISDVKSEPSELAHFEDPLEDPLLQPDQSVEMKEYAVAGGIHTEEEFKMEVEVEETRKTPRFGEKLQLPKKPIPLNTTKTRKFIWSAFKKFCNERQYTLNETISTEQLSEILADWGFNMKKSNGTDYKEGVVKTIWNTTAKMLQELYYDEYKIRFDPFRDIEFKKARDSRDIKRSQLKFHPEKRKISSVMLNEAQRLRIYSIWDENTPTGLQRKFYHIATFELSWKGKEASNCLVTYFRKEYDEHGNFTGRVEYNPSFVMKSRDNSSKSRWLVTNNSNPGICPVRLLFKILEKRNTNEKLTTDRLFLAPNPTWFKSGVGVPWYRDFPVGSNQISTWVREAAEEIGIDTKNVKITNISNCPSTIEVESIETTEFKRYGETAPGKKIIPVNTLKSRASHWTSFKNFCAVRNYTLNESTTTEDLSEILADYAVNMRRADGSDYKEGVVKSIWNTVANMLQEMFYNKYKVKFDPFRDIEFKKARDSRDMKRQQLKSCPEKRRIRYTTLNEKERHKMYSLWDEDTPSGLQRKFFHIASFELSWNTQEASNCLLHYFREEYDETGTFTGRIEYNPTFGSSPEESYSSCASKWLVSNVDSSVCAVRLLQKLLSKRKTNCSINRLFLTPNPSWNKSERNAWFKEAPVGRNQMALWIKEAAERIGIDTKRFKITPYEKSRPNY